jgi:tetratricopeptide (TPR) repeat protein
MSFYFENKESFSDATQFLKKQVLKNYKSTIFQFQKITKSISTFKISFLFIFFIEALLSLVMIINYSKSSIIAISLGVIILSVFTYFVLLFYLQVKKNKKIDELTQQFIESCRHNISIPKGIAEHHLSVASALSKLSYYLNGTEYGYFHLFKKGFTKELSEKISSVLHLEDIFKMQENLFFCAIEEHISQVKITPTDLELHVSLAHIYVSLAKLYMEINEKKTSRKFAKIYKSNLNKKIEIATERAIEEFVILKEFAPNDPWIHAQLAQCYNSLELFEEEVKEYEIMLELSPNDEEIKYRMGRLYFKMGRNAEGLQVYEGLKNSGYKKAEDLLSFYAATRDLEDLNENILIEANFSF